MENRYDEELFREWYESILNSVPGIDVSRRNATRVVTDLVPPGARILDIGGGQGHSAEGMLENNLTISVDVLDASQKMLDVAKARLARFANRVSFFCMDVDEYLRTCDSYPAICSHLTIHNFPANIRPHVYENIARRVRPNGVFVLVDKVYPSNSDGTLLLKWQCQRYWQQLPRVVAEATIAHEVEDYKPRYRMDVDQTLSELQAAGFSDVHVVHREGSIAVIVAVKS